MCYNFAVNNRPLLTPQKIKGERKNTMKKYHNDNTTITAENLMQVANAITIRALTTTYANSGNEKIREMLFDAIAYAHNPATVQGGDGADLIQETALFLWGYAGRSLDDETGDGQTDKDGNTITILRGAFRNIRKLIYGHEQRQYKRVYLTDYENENGEIAVPFMWDIDNYADYITVTDILTALELNENQRHILNKRLQGFSLKEIADTKGTSKQAIANTLAKIGKKYISLYGEIAVPTKG